ncbi:hypothetical protein ACHAW6_015154 [Cyclotella cf. meneghiniana]
MLLCLAGHFCFDIDYVTHQCVCYTFLHTCCHEVALIQIG